MPPSIVTNQVGNQILPPDDPDYIAPGEPTADEQELAAQQRAEAELQAEAERRTPRPRPGEAPIDEHHGTHDAELARLRNERRLAREEMQSERNARAQLERELAVLRARQDVQRENEERVQRLQREAQRPDPDVDPYGAEMWDLKERERQREQKLNELLQEREQQRQYMQMQQSQQQAFQEIQQYIDADVGAFKTQNPQLDYDQAAQFVRDQYMGFWKSTGLNDQEALAVTANTFMAAARSAQLRGQSASSAVWNLAQQWGYKPGEAPRAAAPRQQATETQAEKIRRMNQAQKLQGLGGKTPSERTTQENVETLTAAQLAEMSDDDYLTLKSNPTSARLLEKRLLELG